MFFQKKTPDGNLRRRFHRLLLAKRKENLPTTNIRRPKARRMFKQVSPGMALVKKIMYFVSIALIFMGLIYVALFSSFFEITKVMLEKSGEAVASTALAPFVDKFKGKNLLFVNTDSLTREIEQTFKNQVLLVRIKKSYPHKVIVKVEEYPAVLNLRVLVDNMVQKFVINQIGYSILENSEQKDLPILIWRTSKLLPAGKSVVIDPQKLAPIVEGFTKFKDYFGIKIIEGEWKKVERELHLKTEKNFYVWLDLTQGIDGQLLKLKRALAKLDIYRENLEYIDLRIAGGDNEKVIFKKRK